MQIGDLTEVPTSELSPKHPIEHHPRYFEESVRHTHLSVDRRTNIASASNTTKDLPIDSNSNSEDAKITMSDAEHPLNRGGQAIAFGQFVPQKSFSSHSSPLGLARYTQDGSSKRVSSISNQSNTVSPIVPGPHHDHDLERRPVGNSGEWKLLSRAAEALLTL
jgi:hypothetical protein